MNLRIGDYVIDKESNDYSKSSNGGEYEFGHKPLYLDDKQIGVLYQSSSSFDYCEITGSFCDTQLVYLTHNDYLYNFEISKQINYEQEINIDDLIWLIEQYQPKFDLPKPISEHMNFSEPVIINTETMFLTGFYDHRYHKWYYYDPNYPAGYPELENSKVLGWSSLKEKVDPKYIGIPNINFSYRDEDKTHYVSQRLERGFDDTEVDDLDSAIAKFIIPRLEAFMERDNFSIYEIEDRKTTLAFLKKYLTVEHMDVMEYEKGMNAFKYCFRNLFI